MNSFNKVLCLLFIVLTLLLYNGCQKKSNISLTYHQDDSNYIEGEDIDQLYRLIKNTIDNEPYVSCAENLKGSSLNSEYGLGSYICFDVNGNKESFVILNSIGKINNKIYDPYLDVFSKYNTIFRDNLLSFLFTFDFIDKKIFKLSKEYLEGYYRLEVDCTELPFETYIVGDPDILLKDIYKELFNEEINDKSSLLNKYDAICNSARVIGKEVLIDKIRVKYFINYEGQKYFLIKKN